MTTNRDQDLRTALDELSKRATPGPWAAESEKSEGSYGSGEDTHEGYDTATIVTETEIRHGAPGVLFESHNSTVGSIREEHDDEWFRAWDEVSEANARFIVALVNAYRAGELTPAQAPDKAAEREGVMRVDVRAEAEAYEFRADEGDYTPTEHERAMLEDFGNGLITRVEEELAPQPNGTAASRGDRMMLNYTNYRGERALRTITPWSIEWGSTDWHPEPGWLLTCYDHDKHACRTYALSGIHPHAGLAFNMLRAATPTPPTPDSTAQGDGTAWKIIEAADLMGHGGGPGDFALTIQWPCGKETVEHVSEQAAFALGYTYHCEEDGLTKTPAPPVPTGAQQGDGTSQGAAATRFSDIAAGRAFQPRPHAAAGATEARAALTSQEKTDV